MTENYFDPRSIKQSPYPESFVPRGMRVFISVDQGSPDGGCTVKGFYDPATGEYHIQEAHHEIHIRL